MSCQKQFLFACALSLLVVNASLAIDLFTYEGAGLDGEWSEISAGAGGEVSYGFNGTKVDMNARYNGYNNGFPAGDPQGDADNDDRNEFWVMRFDLSGQDKSQMANISIKLTAMRDSNLQKDLRIWGVNSGTEGLNSFDESALPEDVPGFAEFDFDTTTQSVDPLSTTFLGDFLFPNHPGDIVPLEGDLLTLNQDVLDNSGPNGTSASDGTGIAVQDTLQGYLRSLGSSDMAVFLVGGIGSNGQVRMGTKEATATSTGVFECPAGECAPFLSYEIVDGIAGDYDGDLDIDGVDFLEWQRGNSPNPQSAEDLSTWQTAYGSAPPVTANVTSVPEPGSLVLCLALSLALASNRRLA